MLLLAGIVHAGSYVDWVRPYTGLSSYDYANAVATDSAGNSYVTGESAGAYPAPRDIVTIKYDSDGKVLWVARYDGPAADYDAGWDVTVDGVGNVYVAGKSTGVTSGDDFTVLKYDSAGVLLWDFRYTTPGSISHDRASQLDVDSAGNVYAAGTLFESSTGYDVVLFKLDPNGNEEWMVRMDSGANGDRGVKALVAPDGNIRFLAEYGSDSYMASLTPQGGIAWEITYSLGCDDFDLDSSSNAYITGTKVYSSFDWTTLKISAAGSIEWSDVYDGPAADFDVARAISATPAGEVYVTGLTTGITSDRDMTTAKYDSAGNREWVAVYNGAANDIDDGVDVAAHPTGGCVATGTADMGAWRLDDVVTIKYDSSGIEEWVEAWDDGYGLNNEVAAVALDSSGDVIITGKDPYDYFTVKYVNDYDVDVEVLATPLTQPLEIPATGGSFDYHASIRNNTAQQQSVDAALFVILPNSSNLYGPLSYYSNIPIAAGQTLTFMNITQNVPASAPAGEYVFKVIIGQNWTFMDSSQFYFTKAP